jgi:hypothetical protein
MILIKTGDLYNMEQIIVTGVGASGLIEAFSGLETEIRSIEIDIPLDEVGTTDPTVTVSGSATGAYTVHSDTTLDLRFGNGEEVYITTSEFTAEYTAVIRYVRGGHGAKCHMAKTNPGFTIPVPWRLRD